MEHGEGMAWRDEGRSGESMGHGAWSKERRVKSRGLRAKSKEHLAERRGEEAKGKKRQRQ